MHDCFQNLRLWVLPLLCGVSATAFAALPPDSSLRLGISLYGNSAQSLEAQSRIAGTEIEASFDHALLPTLHAEIAGGMQFEAGAARARWAEDFRPRQIQRLRQAQLRWNPLASLQFIAGAIDQTRWNSPLLLQRQTFPGFHQQVRLANGPWLFQLEAEQAIAADTSSLQPWGQWTSGMPTFYMERLSARFAPSRTDGLELGAHVSHYLFEDLSAPNAFQSQFLGNTVRGLTAQNSVYVYGFQGYEYGFSAQLRVGRYTHRLRWVGTTNLAAPAGARAGWHGSAETGIAVSGKLQLTPGIELFRAESDTAPSFYNDRVFGHNNRGGFGLNLGAHWRQAGFSTLARWIHSDPLRPSSYQSSLDWVQLQLSADYDLL